MSIRNWQSCDFALPQKKQPEPIKLSAQEISDWIVSLGDDIASEIVGEIICSRSAIYDTVKKNLDENQ